MDFWPVNLKVAIISQAFNTKWLKENILENMSIFGVSIFGEGLYNIDVLKQS